jgi:threonine/homoserine/homoserine lactone efflux protein
MDVASLVVSTVVISVSGAMSPGPLTASAVAVGTKRFAKGGFLIAFGHMLFEFPYILVLASLSSNIGFFLQDVNVSYALTLIVISFIVFFSYMVIKEGVYVLGSGTFRMRRSRGYSFNPVLIGVFLTGLNPYFLLWWLSVGLPLIQISASMGLPILLLMYVSHVWMDYFWLTLMGFAGESGVKILKSRGYGVLLILLGLMLALFAVDMSLQTFLNFSLLPF